MAIRATVRCVVVLITANLLTAAVAAAPPQRDAETQGDEQRRALRDVILNAIHRRPQRDCDRPGRGGRRGDGRGRRRARRGDSRPWVPGDHER